MSSVAAVVVTYNRKDMLSQCLRHLLAQKPEAPDILVIDKSLEPTNGDLAVCQVDGEFTLKRLNIQKDRVLLMPSSPNYQPIVVTEENQFMIWGIVTYTIKRNRRPR